MPDADLACRPAEHAATGRARDSVHAHLVLLLGAVVSCGANFCSNESALETCLQGIYSILDNDQFIGLPANKEELDILCKAFNNGMKCVDEYAKSCLSPSRRGYLEQTVAGARITMYHMCDDEEFQKEYLAHAPCYQKIRRELEQCSEELKKVVVFYRSRRVSLNQKEILKRICCAKSEFLTCTERVASKKCDENATTFLRKITESLSGQITSGQCRDVTPTPCKNVSTPSARSRGSYSSKVTAATLGFLGCLVLAT